VGAPDGATTDPLIARSAEASIAGPVGPLDLAVRAERTRFSDGNDRTAVQGNARYTVSPHLALLYAGDRLAFGARSALYWTPLLYIAQAGGVELAARRRTGLSVTVRALPGVAWTEEELTFPDSLGGGVGIRRRLAPQLQAGGELLYRSPRWEMAAGLSYGRGRAGDYQQMSATIQMSLKP
jgi:hypothetical protein